MSVSKLESPNPQLPLELQLSRLSGLGDPDATDFVGAGPAFGRPEGLDLEGEQPV